MIIAVMIIAVMIMTLLAVINEMENRQFTQEKYTPEEFLCAIKPIVAACIFFFCKFPGSVPLLLETELIPGATSNLFVLSLFAPWIIHIRCVVGLQRTLNRNPRI